ncbi:unnamed protein product, partial [Rotaria sordida]
MQNVHGDLGERSFEIPFFYPETADDLRERQAKEELKTCIFCDPAVPNNGGCVVQGNLTLIFVSTCTLDYFLSFIRFAFLKNDHLRNFLKASTQQNIVAETLLQMEAPLRALDWNEARFLWATMIGVVDQALDEQHRSESVFKNLKNLLRQSIVTPIIYHREQISSDHSIFSDDTLNHLFSNQSSLVVGKVVRDHYEKLLQEKSRTYEFVEELYRTVLDEKQQMKRELMYLKGILHSRGVMEEFRGYLHGLLQPRTSTPMSTKKLYMKMLELGTDPSKNTSIVTPLVEDLF